MRFNSMDNDIRDAQNKGLIEIARQPRSERLAELIRSTKAEPYRDIFAWLDWQKINRN
jgi:hypothetical protein